MENPRLRRYVTVAATFSVALGIGFIMQNGDALASRLGVNDKPASIGSVSGDTYRPVTASGMVQPFSSTTGEDALAPILDLSTDDQGAAAGCDIRFEAVPAAAATVNLALSAPCHPETLVTVQHQGMKFNEMTDSAGNLDIQVPALSKEAYFVATVGTVAGVVAITGVQDLPFYDRAVLQWRGDVPLELHAFEAGAAEGDVGHVWRAAAGNITNDQGYLTRLGTAQSTAPLMVEVYTFPSGMSQADDDIALSVRAEVTMANCGQRIAAQSIQLQPGQPPAARSLSLRMPGCDMIGEYLVLKNLFEDMTLASR